MRIRLSLPILLAAMLCTDALSAGELKVHAVYSDNMVIQRDKPITVWGWAKTASQVSVQLGQEKAQAAADDKTGRWEVTLPARPADASGLKLTVACGEQTVQMGNIVIGDVWVMNGQSNMAFGLEKIYEADMEMAAADLPLLRRMDISPNESEKLETDIPALALRLGCAALVVV